MTTTSATKRACLGAAVLLGSAAVLAYVAGATGANWLLALGAFMLLSSWVLMDARKR